MPVDTPKGLVDIFEDFDHDVIGTATGDGIRFINSSDGGDTAFAIAAVAGGIARGATAATNNNLIELSHAHLMWRAQDGFLMMEVRLQIDVITNVAFNIGFNDDALEDSNTLPAELSTTTFTANAATFIGFVFDTDATNDDLHAYWVDDSAATTQAIANLRFTGVGPTAAQYATYRVELQDAGSGNQVIAKLSFTDHLGRQTVKRFTSTIDRDVYLTPYIGVEARSASAHQCDVDYVHIQASRP